MEAHTVASSRETDQRENETATEDVYGGDAEEKAADYIKNNMKKKVVAFIAGRTAPAEKRMGHAGAIISQGKGTAESKVAAFMEAGIPVASIPSEIPGLLK